MTIRDVINRDRSWHYLREHYPSVRVQLRFLPGGLWGRSEWGDDIDPVITLDARLGPIARKVTLLHEIGHLELDTTDEPPVEKWTARWLLPDVAEIGRMLTTHDVRVAATELGVTRRVLLDRLQYLDPDEEQRLAVVMARAS